MTWLIKLWARQPVAIVGIVDAVLVLLVSFNVHIDPPQIAAIDGVLAAIGIFIAASQVTPTSSPVLPTGTPVTTPDGAMARVAAGAPVPPPAGL